MIEDPRCSNVTIKHFCTRLLSDLTAMEKTPFGQDTGKFEMQLFCLHHSCSSSICNMHAAILYAIKL